MVLGAKATVQLPKKLLDVPNFAIKLQGTMRVATIVLQNEAKARSPIGALGLLKQSITGRQRLVPGGLEGQVISSMPYGVPVERGRRKAKVRPPLAPIQLWLQRKLGRLPEEAAREAFAVARAIGRKGITANPFFKAAFKAKRSQINRIFRAGIRRVLQTR